jgi:hypothetical protein
LAERKVEMLVEKKDSLGWKWAVRRALMKVVEKVEKMVEKWVSKWVDSKAWKLEGLLVGVTAETSAGMKAEMSAGD